MQTGYKDRLLEIHGYNMWNMFHVDRAIQFAKKFNMTGIIFHCNELVDKMVFPEKYFTKEELLSYNPVRNSVTKSNRYYLKSVLEKCRNANLEFYAEVKEIFFPYDLLTKYPELRKTNGQICATNPFWWDFLEAKYKEFFELFPEVSGISVSPGTRESMVSFAANRCDCDRCKNYNVDEWYHNLLDALYKPISKAGKRLIVRDFSYTKTHQFAMVDAASSVSKDIYISMKKVPHDYYPVFPDNPAIGNTGTLNQWVEYDAWGQFFGLGVFPCSVAEDMRDRMKRYLEKGVSGITIRTDWENMAQSSTFCSFNMLNLVAGAMFGYNVDTKIDDVYKAWINECGLLSPLLQDSYSQVLCVPTAQNAEENLKTLMQYGWKAIEKAIHIRGHVFNRNSQVFDRYDLPYNIMTVFHSRDQWEPDASKRVEPTDENIPIILQEKEDALTYAKKVADLADPDLLGIKEETVRQYLYFLQKSFVPYVKGFQLEAKTLLFTKRAEAGSSEYAEKARETLKEYAPLAKQYKEITLGKGYSGIVEYMLDGDRLMRYRDSVESVLDKVGKDNEKGS